MIEAFAAYIKTIAAFLIFSVMAELVAPENGYKKYMQIVLGFLMVLVIIQPIQRIFTKDSIDFFAQAMEEKVLAADTVVVQEGMVLNRKDAGLVTEIYKQKLSEAMEESLKQGGVVTKEIEVNVREEEAKEDYGKILSVFIVLEKEEAMKQESDLWTVEIEPVTIEFPKTEGKAEAEETKEEADKKKQVVSILAKEYGVEEKDIMIQFY